MARFELDVVTRFTSAGIPQITDEINRALKAINRTPATGATGFAERVSQTTAGIVRSGGSPADIERKLLQFRENLRESLNAAVRATKPIGAEAQEAVRQLRRAINKSFQDAAKSAGLGTLAHRPPAIAARLNELDPSRRGGAGSASAADAAEGARERRVLAAEVSQILAADREYVQATEALTVARNRLRATVARQTSRDSGNIADLAAADRFRRVERIGVREATSRVDLPTGVRAADEAAAVREKIAANLRAARIATEQANGDTAVGRQSREAAVARRVAEQRLNEAINNRVKQELASTPTSTSRFQRLQAQLHPGQRDPSSYQTFGQFTASRALTTASFAASGAAFYVLQSQITEMIREATQLQTEFRIIEGVLTSVGEAGQQSFEQVREGILQVARDTATAADEVARIQRSLAGVFADPETLTPDFDQARIASESALRLQRVTGLPTREISDSVAAVTLAYNQGAESVEGFGDVLVGLESQFGVSSSELVRFAAQIAGAAAELDIPQDQLLTIGAALLQVTESGSGAAEQLRRVIPALQENAADVIRVFSSLGEGAAQELAASFGANDISGVLDFMLENFQQLSEGAQNQLASLIGGSRQAGTVLALFNRGPGILTSLNQGSDQFAGDLDERFSAVSQSVGFALDRLERAVEELGIALFDAGLSDALIAAADAGQLLAEVLGAILGVAGEFNDALGGMPAKILAVAAALRVLQGLNRARGSLFGAGGTFGPGAIPAVELSGALPGAPVIAAGPASAVTGAAGVRARAIGRAQALATSKTFQALSTIMIGQFLGDVTDSVNIGGQGSAADQGISGALRGAGIGAAAGSIIPGVGTLAGGLIGGGVGALVGLVPRQPELEAYGQERSDYYTRVKDALAAFANQDAEAGRLIAAIANEGLNDENYRRLRSFVRGNDLLDDAEEVEDAQATIQELEAGSGRRQLQFEQAIQAFEAGIASQNDVIDAFNEEIRIQERLSRAAVSAGEDSSQYDLAAFQAQQDLSEFLVAQVNQRFDRQQSIIEAFSGGGEDTQSLQVAQGRLSALQDSGASQQELENAAFAIINVQRSMLEEQIAATEDLGSQISLGQRGVIADANASAVIIQGQLRSLLGSGLQEIIDRIATASDNKVFAPGQIVGALERVGGRENATEFASGLSDKDIDAIVQQIVETGEAETDVVRAIVKNLDTRLKQIGVLMRRAGSTRDAKKLFPELLSTTRQREQLQEVLGQLESAAGEVPDSVTSDTSDLEQKVEDTFVEVQNARFDLLEAQVANDPVAVARIAQERAQFAIQTATSEAARIQGEADRVRADNQLQDALNAIVVSQSELLIAYAEAAGDVGKVAQLQLDQARSALERGLANGTGEAELNGLRADVVNAEANLRQTQLQQSRDNIDFALEMEWITTQQAIAQLEALLSIANPEEQKELMSRIKALRDQATADFQFNIPDTIDLPTLYEVRRLNQTPSGQSYQDNRQIQVNFTANNTADAQSIANTIVDQFSRPSRFGSTGRRY